MTRQSFIEFKPNLVIVAVNKYSFNQLPEAIATLLHVVCLPSDYIIQYDNPNSKAEINVIKRFHESLEER
jgi:hypothetical protein